MRLDPDADTAFAIWHHMQAAQCYTGKGATVRGLLNAFLDDIDGTVSEARLKTLTYYGRVFVDDFGTNLVDDIKPSTLQQWLRSPKPGKLDALGEPTPDIQWGASSQRHAAAFVKRAWKWAHNAGHIKVNKLAAFALPECEYREGVIDSSTHAKLIEHLRKTPEARPFALYLIASRCGARPQQIREVTAKHVSQDGKQWIFAKHKTQAKTGKPLVVYLPPCLQTLTRLLVQVHPTGPLFRNAYGEPWKSDTVTQRMERLRRRLKLPADCVAYLYRHTMATDALLAGQTPAIVAKLMGHVDTRMISKVYSHLEKHPQHLVDAVAQVAANRVKDS